MQPLQRVKNGVTLARVAWSFLDLVKNPDHLDRVFEISNGLVSQHLEVLEAMARHFERDTVGAAALREKPRLDVDLEALSKLRPGTLGREFADHMRRNGLDPAAIPTLSADDERLFVRAHLYETHDVWHAVTGFTTDVAGELGLQAFYAAQAPGNLPWMLLTVGFFNTALYARGERNARLDAVARGWAMGRRARPLFGVRWNDLWSTPIDEVRRSLDVDAFESPAMAAA
jgi:ubiquinone biosynthesis protein Coq4